MYIYYMKSRRIHTMRGNRTKKRGGRKTGSSFEKEVVVKFLQILNTIKLYHWRTNSYATHKATDDAYDKLNANIDKFVEVLLGKELFDDESEGVAIKVLPLIIFGPLLRGWKWRWGQLLG